MIAGVRMRLCVMVWKSTDDTATAYATSSIAASLPPRNGITNDHWPLAPKVMNATTHTKAATPSHIRRNGCGARRTASRVTASTVSAKAVPPRAQQPQEQDAAQHADDRADGDFIRVDDEAADDVAGQHEDAAQRRDPGDGTAHVVSQHQADGVGHDQAQERDAARRHHHHGRNRGHDQEADECQACVIQPQV
ncbi:hypothetical protein G6F40_014315 [Rhizopus arrhizus]|nr:hypothetical protein G6F40_014315 [Rhizopus arrhizus]